MLTVFFSASKKSRYRYPLIFSKLKEMERNEKIILNHFPGFNYIKEQNYFPKAIMQAITQSDIVVALLDKEGRKNQWINQEVGYAMAKEIDILALAESRKELMGFVNMYTKNVIEGNKFSLPKDMEKWLLNLAEEKEEAMYHKILENKLKEIIKIIEWEEYQLQIEEVSGEPKNVLDSLKNNILKLQTNYEDGFYKGFYSTAALNTIITEDLPRIAKANFKRNFKKHFENLNDDIKRLLYARKKNII